ncbi:S-methylmethionine--homocysteine S-methyltransferase BHMT2 [Echinops telfairi]|uniref:S-methylmethionine--homocysteine S-methyltransferase BHMT2 n=1 Tax=Echinops telfairi TaxID=9371 RepID=A0AC55CQ00_ECHTE|nr:S-methylmethionine--homocysteine S-methyltransferase BHMT2 [Echinops telfairi]
MEMHAFSGFELKAQGILQRLDSGEVVIGDGGFLFTLEKRGYVKAGLWTPEAVVEHPNAVRQLHMEFLRAGSNVMQTFAFSASEDTTESKWEDINAAACDLAREVGRKGDALVAGGICQTSTYKLSALPAWITHLEEPFAETGMNAGPTMNGNIGASIVGVNCRFGPTISLKTMRLMKEGLQAAGLKAHLMVQSLGFHTPDCGKGGFVDLPEYPFGMEPRLATRWDIQKYAREAYKLGVRFIGGCCGFEPYHIRAIAEELAPERGFLPPASEKHGSWGSGLDMHTKPWIRARARKEHWENLRPASGRPFCPSMSKPDA